MLWNILSQEEKNELLIKILVHLSKADNILNEDEFTYLVHVCRNLNISPEVIRKFASEKLNLNEIYPENEQDRMNILYHLLFTMNADGEVTEDEQKMLYLFSFKLGFHEEMTRDFIELMKMYKIDDLPENSMINIVRKYRN